MVKNVTDKYYLMTVALNALTEITVNCYKVLKGSEYGDIVMNLEDIRIMVSDGSICGYTTYQFDDSFYELDDTLIISFREISEVEAYIFNKLILNEYSNESIIDDSKVVVADAIENISVDTDYETLCDDIISFLENTCEELYCIEDGMSFGEDGDEEGEENVY